MQRLAYFHALLADLPPDGGKLGACRVRDLVFGEDGGKNAVLQKLIRHELEKPHVEHGFHAFAVGIIFDLPRAFEHAADLQKLFRTQNTAALRARQRRADIPRTGKPGRPLEGDELAGGARLLLQRANFVRIRERDGLPAALLGSRARRLLRKQLQYLIKL